MSKSTTGTVRRKVGERALEWTSESGSRSSASRHVHRRTRGALGAAQRGRGSGILPRPVLGCSAPRPLPSAAPPTCGPCAPPLQPIPAAPTPCCCSAPRRPLRLQPPRPPRCGPGGPRSPRPCPARGPRPAPRRFLAPGTDPRDTGWPGRGEAGSGVVPGGGTQGPIRRGAARCGPPGDTPWPVPFRPPTRPILFTFSFFKVGGIGSGLGGGETHWPGSEHLPGPRRLHSPAPRLSLCKWWAPQRRFGGEGGLRSVQLASSQAARRWWVVLEAPRAWQAALPGSSAPGLWDAVRPSWGRLDGRLLSK